MTEHARRHSPGIADDGRAKVLAGVTTVNEVMRVSLADEVDRVPLASGAL